MCLLHRHYIYISIFAYIISKKNLSLSLLRQLHYAGVMWYFEPLKNLPRVLYGCNTTRPGNQSKRMYDKVVRKYKNEFLHCYIKK
jgi:hypothetical protein